MHTLSLVLSPIILPMRVMLELAHGLVGNYGVSIILMSAIVRFVTAPIAKLARASEDRNRMRHAAMQRQLSVIKATSKGRERFERTEALYRRHNYHPIMAVSAALPLVLQIPFLLSALLLLSVHPPLSGQPFLLIRDLSRPDGLIPFGVTTINLLPLLICLTALVESAINDADRGTKLRFLIMTGVIVGLIYAAPAGVCLYWLTSNLLSLGRALAARRFDGVGAS
jgi:YidC/Oxa1 family membrane protein insertase